MLGLVFLAPALIAAAAALLLMGPRGPRGRHPARIAPDVREAAHPFG